MNVTTITVTRMTEVQYMQCFQGGGGIVVVAMTVVRVAVMIRKHYLFVMLDGIGGVSVGNGTI